MKVPRGSRLMEKFNRLSLFQNSYILLSMFLFYGKKEIILLYLLEYDRMKLILKTSER